MDLLNTTVANLNFSSPGLKPQSSLDLSRLVPAVMLCLCFVLGVPGNVAVIILKPNWRHMSSLSQRLMLNLAVFDLLCLLTLPLWIHNYLHGWTFGLVTCKLIAYVVYFSIYGSLLTVTGLSIQRYLVMVHQMGCHQVRERLLLVLLWFLAFILSIRYLVVQQLVPDEQWTDCRAMYSSDAKRVAALMIETLLGFVCFSSVAFSYIHIQRKITQTAFSINRQTTRLVTSIILSFIILWAPYYFLNVLSVAAISLKKDLLMFCTDMRRTVVALTFVHSCLNPLLYAFASRKNCAVCQKNKALQQDQRMPQDIVITSAA